jgi:hypothetical protein
VIDCTFTGDWKQFANGPQSLNPPPTEDEILAAKLNILRTRPDVDEGEDEMEFERLVVQRIIEARIERKLLAAESAKVRRRKPAA